MALIDSGIGPRWRRGYPEGHLDQALEAAGVSPAVIDLVIHTHLHLDHVGWNTCDTPQGDPEIFFPNARVRDPAQGAGLLDDTGDARRSAQRDPARMHSPGPRRRPGDAGQRGRDPVGAGRLHPYARAPLAMSRSISRMRGERALIIGDSSHHPFHVAHPDWPSPVDLDPQLAIGNRGRLYDLAADDQRLVIGGHWRHPGWGRIVREGGRRTFRPGTGRPAVARSEPAARLMRGKRPVASMVAWIVSAPLSNERYTATKAGRPS